MQEAAYSYEQLTLFDECDLRQEDNTPVSSYGRTSPVLFPAIGGWIFKPCSKKSEKLKFHYLNMADGQKREWLTCQAVKSRGESSTRNIGASPNVVEESFLSQILQDTVPEKYYLSARACEGVLRRAEKRGKELPPELKAALEAQASCGCVQDAPGGGKGALVSRERSLTLAANTNDQVLFTGNCLTPWDCQAKRIYKQDGVFPCLQSTESNGEKPGSVYVPDKARSLTARADGSPCVDRGPDVVAAGFKAGAGADAGGLGYQVEQMPTLTSAESGTQRPTVAVYGVGIEKNGKAGTLDASYYKGTGARSGKERTCVAVFDMTHADEVMRKVPGGRIPTLNARMGTGGNQVPVVHTYTQQALGHYEEIGKASALKQRDYKDATYLVCCKTVRRLTPTECERLQGLPDGYTLVGNASDTQRYKALGNGMAMPCALYVMRRIVECCGGEKDEKTC